MTVFDETRPGSGVLARCEGCGLVYEVDLLDESAGSVVVDCDDCGSPVYALAAGDEAVYLAGFGAGWDACAAFVQGAATGEQLEELTDSVEWAARLAGGVG
jgi:hypothetical protein